MHCGGNYFPHLARRNKLYPRNNNNNVAIRVTPGRWVFCLCRGRVRGSHGYSYSAGGSSCAKPTPRLLQNTLRDNNKLNFIVPAGKILRNIRNLHYSKIAIFKFETFVVSLNLGIFGKFKCIISACRFRKRTKAGS